jgi:hypothetical protein
MSLASTAAIRKDSIEGRNRDPLIQLPTITSRVLCVSLLGDRRRPSADGQGSWEQSMRGKAG